MKKILAWCLSIGLFTVPAFVFAAGGDGQGPSDRAYEKADENARFKRGDEGKARQAKDEENRAKKVKKRAGQGSQGDPTTVDDEEQGRPADHQKKKAKGQEKKRK